MLDWFTLLKVRKAKKQFRASYKNKNFDVSSVDKALAEVADEIYAKYCKSFLTQEKNSDKIAFFATELYETGGHTQCLFSVLKSLHGEKDLSLFLSCLDTCEKKIPNKMASIKQFANVDGVEFKRKKLIQNLIILYNKIVAENPCVAFVFTHPNDIIFTMAVHLLKKYTDIKIIFINHASHFPSLMMSFADLILEGMPSTQKITEEKRHFHNCQIIGLQSLTKDETIYYTNEQKEDIKKKLGVANDELLTMSGGSSYKFFDGDTSEYFEMIQRLLIKEPNLKHVIISELSEKQKDVVNNIFIKNPLVRERLIFVPYCTYFDDLFQCADVFIDSFPVSSALTQIDLMRNKVASVVKINVKSPELSFHEYQMPNYLYMFERTEDMELGVFDLLYNKDKRLELVKTNYEYWLNTYESNVYKNKLIKIIEGKYDSIK